MTNPNGLKKVRELRPEELVVPKSLSEPDMPLAHALSVRVSWLNTALEHQTHALLKQLASLSMLEWRCLATLCVHGPKNGQEIASLCNVNIPQASRGLRALKLKGHISWNAGSERRSYGPAHVTEKGWQIYKKVSPVMRRRNQWLLSDLSTKEKKELFRLLAIVRQKISDGTSTEDLLDLSETV